MSLVGIIIVVVLVGAVIAVMAVLAQRLLQQQWWHWLINCDCSIYAVIMVAVSMQ